MSYLKIGTIYFTIILVHANVYDKVRFYNFVKFIQYRFICRLSKIPLCRRMLGLNRALVALAVRRPNLKSISHLQFAIDNILLICDSLELSGLSARKCKVLKPIINNYPVLSKHQSDLNIRKNGSAAWKILGDYFLPFF